MTAKRLKQDASAIQEKTTNDSFCISESNDYRNGKYERLLTKLMVVIRSFLSHEKNKSMQEHTCISQYEVRASGNEERSRNTDKNKCRFIASYCPSKAHAISRNELLKLYMWVDEVWTLSMENSSISSKDGHSVATNAPMTNVRKYMTCTYLDQHLPSHRVNFYHNGNSHYVFKSFDPRSI